MQLSKWYTNFCVQFVASPPQFIDVSNIELLQVLTIIFICSFRIICVKYLLNLKCIQVCLNKLRLIKSAHFYHIMYFTCHQLKRMSYARRACAIDNILLLTHFYLLYICLNEIACTHFYLLYICYNICSVKIINAYRCTLVN